MTGLSRWVAAVWEGRRAMLPGNPEFEKAFLDSCRYGWRKWKISSRGNSRREGYGPELERNIAQGTSRSIERPRPQGRETVDAYSAQKLDAEERWWWNKWKAGSNPYEDRVKKMNL